MAGFRTLTQTNCSLSPIFLHKGVEADASFYIGSADQLRDRIHIDLEFDPPPDLVAEIDTTNESGRKFAIYAALRVPEIWQYGGEVLRFYKLTRTTYNEIHESGCLPGITPTLLERTLKHSKIDGQSAALREFRKTLHISK